MRLLFIALAIGAVVLAWGTPVLIPAIVNAIVAFWSNGVLSNFVRDPENAPNWAVMLSFLTFVTTIGLGTVALLVR